MPAPIAREEEAVWFRTALQRSRFLVVTGPEGVGKTHLVGWSVPQAVDCDIVWARLEKGESLADRLAEVVEAADASLPALIARFGDGTQLLVVDDLHYAEDLGDAMCLLRELLEACAGLSVIAISRARPDVYGIAELPLPLLTVPAFDETTLPEIRRTQAMELWCHLYRDQYGREPRAADLRRGAEIVREVDGLPLGIVASIRSAEELPTIIQGCAERAYATLSYQDALALAALGQFQRRWPIELAVPMLQPWMAAAEAERCIDRLVNASVVQRSRQEGRPVTFRIVRSLRHYGHALLRAEKQFGVAESAYTRTMCQLARDAYDQSTIAYPYYQRLFLMHFADLDAAWTLLVSKRQYDTALELTANVWPYWNVSGNMRRFQEVVERILQLSSTQSAYRVRCLHASGVLYHLQGEWLTSRQRHNEAIALAEELDDAELQGLAWYGLGQCGLHSGENSMAEHALLQAERFYTHASAVRGLANVQMMLAILYWNQQRLDRAASIAEAALRWFESVGEDAGQATAHAAIGRIRLDMGDEPRAAFYLFRALELAERIQDQTVLAESLEGFAKLGVNQKRYVPAARLLGAAAKRRSQVEHPGWPSTFVPLKLTLRELSSELAEAFDEEFARGQRLSWEHVLEQLSELAMPVSSDIPTVSLVETGSMELKRLGLTTREREVLVMLAMGAPDREIAEALRIGVRTVHSHVHHVILKLGATSRAAAVASAWRLGVLE